jgi:hypothetical protein
VRFDNEQTVFIMDAALPSSRNNSSLEESSRFISNGPPRHTYKFDRIFKPEQSQNEIFDFIGRDIVEDAISGINSTVLAYGQTGGGKTYTMYGTEEQ